MNHELVEWLREDIESAIEESLDRNAPDMEKPEKEVKAALMAVFERASIFNA